jgi:voltage-gated potassium channel Kch
VSTPGRSGTGTARARRAVGLRRFWRRYWWAILTVVFAGALLVAFLGTQGDGLWARLERTVLLLPIANRTDTEGLPRQVKLAYFVVAGVILFATYRAALALFGEQVRGARAGLRRGHAVVYGLGGQGQALVESMLGESKVVAVEKDGTSPAVERLRDAGATVLVGDATDPEIHRKTNVDHARRVIALCGQDAVNARICASLLERPSPRNGHRSELFVHIADPRLYTFLLHHSFASRGPRLELFNVFERGARGLSAEARRATSDELRSVLVVGAGQLGLALVSQLARDRYERTRAPMDGKLLVHLVDREAPARVQLLTDRYCRLLDVAELVPHELDVESPAFDRLLSHGSGLDDVDLGFVCFDSDTLTIATALNLIDQSRGRFTVVARVTERSEAIARMIEQAHSRYAERVAFRPLTVVERAARADLALEGTLGQLARGIHEVYRENEPGGPYDMPWADLPAAGRARNVRHAESIVDQLEASGYRLGPLIDWGTELTAFTPDEVEHMSKLEHERWMAERETEGWRYDASRDDAARLHPDLVPWDTLTDDRKDINRRLIRARPALLAAIGIQVHRA